MHRVHHSARPEETDSNFGFNLLWWDRLFGTYRDQPRDGHLDMIIGLEYFRGRQAATLSGLLAQPFLNERSTLARTHHQSDPNLTGFTKTAEK